MPRVFPPKGWSEISPPQPVPYTAVAGEPAVQGGELTANLGVTPEPTPITVHIDGDNLVDIIADLLGRIDALENTEEP